MKIMIKYPCVNFQGFEYVIKKYKELDETEAILLAFIYETSEKQASVNFFQLFCQTFNLNQQKWINFFTNVLKKLIASGAIIEPQKIDENTFCGDFKLHEKIKEKIKDNDFKGMESKSITKKVECVIPLRKDLFLHSERKLKISDPNIIKITETKTPADERFIELANKNKFLDEIKSDISLEANQLLETIKHPKDKEYNDLCYYKMPLELEAKFENGHLAFNSGNKKILDLFSELYFEKGNEELLFSSVTDTINSLTNKFHFNTASKDSNHLEFIEIDEYTKYFELLQSNQKKINWTENYFFKDNKVYEIVKKQVPCTIIKKQEFTIELLFSQQISTIQELFMQLFKDPTKPTAYNLIELIDFSEDKQKIEDFLRTNEDVYFQGNLSQYKSYLLNQILINNQIKFSEALWALKSANISFAEWNKLVDANKTFFKENFEKLMKQFSSSNFSQVESQKTTKLLTLLDKSIDEINIDDQFINFLKRCPLIEFVNSDEWKTKPTNELEIIAKELQEKAIGYVYGDKELAGTIYKPYFDKLAKIILNKKYEDWKQVTTSFANFNDKWQELNKLTNNIEDVISSKQLKDKIKEIRKLRNEFTHSKSSEITEEKLKQKSTNEIRDLNWKFIEATNWIKQNFEAIKKEVGEK